ncbi:MAG TPA: FUSC family protein, partial [Stellaceae bacterium]|nr:FUSC family protein [Stellaceae bacterium]
MTRTLKHLSRWLGSSPTRIALSTALRGTIASAAPLAILPHFGLGDFAYPAVLGALATSMVDIGGPYRSRLIAMLIQGLGGAALLWLGMLAVNQWWLAAAVMAGICVFSGMIRAVGPGGASLGINTAVAFLVGLSVGEEGGGAALWTLGYAAGGVWTVVVALAFWHVRPYHRLEQEVASAWEAVAELLAAVASEGEAPTVVTRRRREQQIAARHAAARQAVEAAREALGETRARIAGPGTTIAQLIVLLNAAGRIGAAAVALGEIGAPAAAPRLAAGALRQASLEVARILLDGKGTLPLAPLRARLQALADGTDRPPPAALLACAQAMRHFENAEEALGLLFGERRGFFELLRLAFAHRRPRGAVIAALRPHLSPRSAIFRHAFRVAAVSAIDTAVIARFHLPRGIWLPMTSLIILQPDYGGTLLRASQRTAGTIAGAVLASLLLTTLHGTVEYDAMLALLLFATFLLIRQRYGYGITFLTPIVILLIGMSSPAPWIDLGERVAYTVAGAVLAIAAGYLLWPSWEREQLRERLARALRSDRAYLAAVLAAIGGEAEAASGLGELLRQAELDLANADAGFQRMLGDPARRRAPVGEGFTLLLYLHRLCRHAIALAAQPAVADVPAAPLATLSRLIEGALDQTAEALAASRA